MQTKYFYYFILLVYSLLWLCQMITCHLTHSLIVLTDSYINLYNILEISLEILHLKLQHEAQGYKTKNGHPYATIYCKFFNRTCTYQYKRLPVLGSFVNSLFLAALLMSAAIEGIQTCFHASHSNGEEKSILLQNQITYPAVLVGFGLVGLILKWCASKVHKLRNEELGSNSILNLAKKYQPLELDPSTLLNKNNLLNNSQQDDLNNQDHVNESAAQDDTFETIPLDTNDTKPQVEYMKLQTTNTSTITSKSKDIEANDKKFLEQSNFLDFCLLVKHCISPISLILCAFIIYFINNELTTEVSDALVAVFNVVLLFSLSYPPMKKASKILLQSAPIQFPLEEIKLRIKSVSSAIIEVKNLHVWSLSARNNPIATCDIVLRKEDFTTEKTLTALLKDVRFKFMEENIECCTVQPVFVVEENAQLNEQGK